MESVGLNRNDSIGSYIGMLGLIVDGTNWKGSQCWKFPFAGKGMSLGVGFKLSKYHSVPS